MHGLALSRGDLAAHTPPAHPIPTPGPGCDSRPRLDPFLMVATRGRGAGEGPPGTQLADTQGGTSPPCTRGRSSPTELATSHGCPRHGRESLERVLQVPGEQPASRSRPRGLACKRGPSLPPGPAPVRAPSWAGDLGLTPGASCGLLRGTRAAAWPRLPPLHTRHLGRAHRRAAGARCAGEGGRRTRP